MDLKPSEVATVLKSEIEGFAGRMQKSSVGTVLMVGDGTARVHGLDDCMMNEMLDFGNGIFGVALNLEEDNVGAVLLGSDAKVKEGDTVRTTGRVISVPTGLQMCGRVVDALGRAVDGKGDIKVGPNDLRPIEGRSPTVPERQPVKEPLQTGIKAIDSMIPIGRGQRELIIGDRGTGKTALIVDTFINQKLTGGGDPNNPNQVICIYVAVGQKQSTVKAVVDKVRDIHFIGNVKFHIDSVAGLGDFVEIEVIDRHGDLPHDEMVATCEKYMKALDIEQGDLMSDSYSDQIIRMSR
jgi:F-type H+-transporting ATPase subunit alpha